MKLIPDKNRNGLTEPRTSYKLYNPYLIDSYAAIMPSSLSKISLVIFNGILSNKRYYKETSVNYSEVEAKRIYNSILMTPEYILQQCNPAKYAVDAKSLEQDIGNLVKKVGVLEDNNVFYIWKSGFPYVYIFFMERDIGVWKFFNQKGVVIPKTLAKILRAHRQVIENMDKMLKQDKQVLEQHEIENSFGLFINKMISKMNPEVAKKLSVWKGNGNLSDYISFLLKELHTLNEFEGLEEDSEFAMRLPPTIKDRLVPKDKQKENKMDMLTLEKSLVPANENLVKTRKTTRKRLMKNYSGAIVAPIVDFEGCDPFENCNEFISFYKEIVRTQFPDAKFLSPDSQRKVAAEILDMLILGKKNNKRFLKGWISYFARNKLQGGAAFNRDKTSLDEFKKTFLEFSLSYVELV